MRRIAEGVRNYIRAAALSNGGAGTTIAQQVAVILAKYGTDAHVYLPGIGVINGLTAGNYLDSAGTTAATVDNPVGLVLDAGGSVGGELVTNGDFSNGLTGWTSQNINAGVATFPNVTSGTLRVSRDGSNNQGRAYQSFTTVIGKTYKFTINASVISGANGYQFLKSDDVTVYANLVTFTNANTGVFTATATTSYIICAAGVSTTASFDNISVKEITGIHALQATTANKPILRLSAGRYYFDFVDGTDVLNATYPAGWESVTTIDAAPTGQATLTAQNIVGTYAITTDTYGRFVFKTITASELAIVQSFCNRLAGV